MRKAMICILTAAITMYAVSSFAEEEGLIQKIRKKMMGTKTVTVSTIDEKGKAIEQTPEVLAKKAEENEKLIQEQKASMGSQIQELLDTDQQILQYVPGLKANKVNNKNIYVYNDVELEKLDAETLQGLSNKILTEVSRLRSEVVQQQMDQVKQAQTVQAQLTQVQQVQAMQNQMIRSAPSVPRTPSNPQILPTPTLPATNQRVSSAPAVMPSAGGPPANIARGPVGGPPTGGPPANAGRAAGGPPAGGPPAGGFGGGRR